MEGQVGDVLSLETLQGVLRRCDSLRVGCIEEVCSVGPWVPSKVKDAKSRAMRDRLNTAYHM